MKVYQIKSKTGKKFWTVQPPIEEQLVNEDVIGEETISEDFLLDISEEDKNYLILELAQMLRFNHVEEKLAIEKNRKRRKARKSL